MKTLRNSIFVLFFILFQPILSGSESIPTGKETVTVHVYRPKKLVGFAWTFNLKLDGEKCGLIKNGDHLVFELEPGKRLLA